MSDTENLQSRRALLTRPPGMAERLIPHEQICSPVQPSAGITVRLGTRAMACDFSVILNPGPTTQIELAGQALEAIHAIEDWLSIYRAHSDLSRINRTAGEGPQTVRGDLFELLQKAEDLHRRTHGAFDMATGALTKLWKTCRQNQTIPAQSEIDVALAASGMAQITLDPEKNRVSFSQAGLILDPGAIGKGYALDVAADLIAADSAHPESFLLHGGHSSLLARGGHNGHRGWPVGIGNPLFTEKRLGTLLLRDQAMATSGSNIQFFRYEGKRYGHILDPRTGWPVAGMLSVTVLAPSGAVADALSTAFFVMGVEKALECCEKWPEIGAILIPFPAHGRKVRPEVTGIPPEQIVWDPDQVDDVTRSTSPKRLHCG